VKRGLVKEAKLCDGTQLGLFTTSQYTGKQESLMKNELWVRQLWAVLLTTCLAEQRNGMGGRELWDPDCIGTMLKALASTEQMDWRWEIICGAQLHLQAVCRFRDALDSLRWCRIWFCLLFAVPARKTNSQQIKF